MDWPGVASPEIASVVSSVLIMGVTGCLGKI